MNGSRPLEIVYIHETDEVVIEGIRYSGTLFREWGMNGALPGTLFKIAGRKEGVLTIERMDEVRLRIGPTEIKCKKCGTTDTLTIDLGYPDALKREEKSNGGS